MSARAAIASQTTDGRRRRSEASRTRIIEAMIALVQEGQATGLPSAELVAERAGVGLRTVFRLFEDMDGLYRGMQAVMMERIGAYADPPPVGDDWRAALDLLVERRSVLFEEILLLQVAADSQRHRSPALQEGRARIVRILREALGSILPEAVCGDRDLVQALELTTSFEAWRRLRLDQDLPPADALRVMQRVALRLADGQT